MKPVTFWTRLAELLSIEGMRQRIADIGWDLFLWGNRLTAEEYWDRIYKQEKAFRKGEGASV